MISFDLIETDQIPKYDEIFQFRNSSLDSEESVVSPRFDYYGYEYRSLI